MCPAALTIPQMQMLSTGLQVAGQVYAHQEQKKAHRENAEAAAAAKAVEDQQTMIQQSYADQDAAQEKLRRNEEIRRKAARAEVAAGESGGFLNNNAGVQDILRQGLVANQATSQNLERQTTQTGFDLMANQNRAQSRINQVAKPDAVATGLNIAGTVAGGYSNSAMAGTKFGNTTKVADVI